MSSRESISIFGVSASPGIVIGPVLFLGRRRFRRPDHRCLDVSEVGVEVERFQGVVDRVEEQLREIRQQFISSLDGYASIIDSHLLMLRDRMLYDRTIAIIEQEKKDAEWALDIALNEAREIFSQIDDPYLRERVHDVEQVAERVFRLLAGRTEDKFAAIDKKVIIAARDFAPEDILRMRNDQVLGFFTEKGGETSHTAIVARTLGIPAVVGAEEAVRQVVDGETVVLDGISGRIILSPSREQLDQYYEHQRQYRQYSEQVALYAHLSPETPDGLKVRVEANIEMVEEAIQAISYGAGGIGLFRSEYHYLGRSKLPDEGLLFEVYRNILTAISPFAVTIRTLDIGGDKLPAGDKGGEANPALGLRAIRLSLRDPLMFKTQLRALLRASVYGNLRIMFPMIASMGEVLAVKGYLAEVMAELAGQKIPFNEQVPIGIMIEVPGAVSIADVLAKEVDFFSIGTNDLIQYALAIDRGNENVAHMYEPFHPAVLRMIRQVVEAGHEAGIEVGMCGEMAGDMSCLPVLLGLGLDQLSMNSMAIPYVKRMIRHSIAEEAEQLAASIFRCASSREVYDLLGEYLPRHYPDEFGPGGIRTLRKSGGLRTVADNKQGMDRARIL
ncbi:MAG: phosphoenolpyruvate--protein phosphotransferase [Desulfobulbaceae bacterium]|nr:phosphoenolpyruvate--protein phosphotransferase [Desulfobulbaceae bacterium]HIJ78063.1 phosphoenolpyruvate--protein phosphotransferase [Deltaproteobacteria bacterium]